jgi:two-component system, chemotaxis family, sensor kinase CheA
MMIEDEELRNLYHISSEERLQHLEAGLLHLQKYPDDETTLKELRREAHNLRGDSRGVGVEAVETLAHCVEKILGSIIRKQLLLTPLLSDRPRGTSVADRIEQGLAAIRLLVQEAVTDQPSGVDVAQVIELLTVDVSELQQDAPAEETVEFAPQPLVNNGDRATVPTAIATLGASVQIASLNDNTVQSATALIEDEDLRELYHITSLERLQNLEAGLQHLQKHPNDETTLGELQREAHSLLGDSRSAEVETVEVLAHALEEIVLSIKHQQIVLTQEVSDRLYQGLAAIHGLVQEAVTGQPSGVDVAEVFESWMEVALESQQDGIPDVEQDKEGSFSQPTPYDHTPEFVAPTSKVQLNGNISQRPSVLIEDEDFREIYKTTSEERLQKLEAGLLYLEKQPNDESTLEELLREAHSLKGDSRSADLETVETLTHAVEEILLSIKRQQTVLTQEVSDCLYHGLDAIALLVHEAVTGQQSNVDTARVLEQLTRVVAVPTIPESLPVSLEPLSANLEAITTQDLPTPSLKESEPYRIDTIRVHTHELDALMTQAEELIVTKIHIAHATTEIEELARLWEKWKAFYKKQRRRTPSLGTNPYQEHLDKAINSLTVLAQENTSKLNLVAGELREKIRTLRLLPLSTLFQFFPRIVRDLARQQAKEVELIIAGGETTADKRILEDIKDSLMHMIRNAIDHGIETPDEREKLGKPRVATIWLRGCKTANNMVIEIADDGRGLDSEKIKQTAIKRKLYRPEELETMTPNQIYSLIFTPGFSTRTFITEISGRGIGLDVVRTNVERLKGTIQIESIAGQGCTFRLQLGTSLATLNALLLNVQGIVHALPMEYVPASLLVSQDEISTIEGRETITWNGQTIPVADLGDLLQLSHFPTDVPNPNIEEQISELRPCILLKIGEEQAGFFVDRLLDTQEIAIKPQSQLLKRVRNVIGATILPTGEVCMILNPPDLLKSLHKQTLSTTVSIKPQKTIARKPVILLVEDSTYVRTQEQRLLEKAGYEVVIAVDGLDGYNKLKNREFDAVISDVEMPKLDGFSLTAKIRQHREYKNLPIILVTTLNSDEDKRRGADAGADAYILKGKFNQGLLLETLARLV